MEDFKWEIHWIQTKHGSNGVYYSNAETLEEAINECKKEKMYHLYTGELIRPDFKITSIYKFVQYGE